MEQMALLSLNQVEGRHTVYSKYVFGESGGVQFIKADSGATLQSYNPMKSSDALLLDILKTAETVLECGEFWTYCAERTPDAAKVRDLIFWQGDDFFIKSTPDAANILKALLVFVHTYGLPEWMPTRSIEVEIPDRYVHLLAKVSGAETASKYSVAPQKYADYQQKYAHKEVIPVGSLALLMVQLYERFLLQRNTYFHLERTEITFAHDSGKEPELTVKALGLMSCIELSYILLASGRGGAIRQCKHCGTVFIAEDIRAEYCSKKCRGAYNSAMTRKRKKEQQ